MDRNELLELLSADLLWEIISAKVEEVNQIPAMLKNIGYLDDKEELISQINNCEVFDSEPLNVIGFTVQEEKIFIDFEMSFLLSAWHDEKSLLRITAAVSGKCSVPDVNVFDWENRDAEEAGIVNVLELNYVDVECDDMRVV